MRRNKVKIGDVFGYWTVIGEDEKINGTRKNKCKCKCGREKYVAPSALISGSSGSCGCKGKLGGGCGESSSRFYGIWCGMKSRCNPKNYVKDYGKRGIHCKWKTYKAFKKDMYESYLEHVDKYGERQTTIDRIDVNGDYCKENCRRATMKEQAVNKRKTLKRCIDGLNVSFAELCRMYNLDYNRTYYLVYKRGEPLKQILINNGYTIGSMI